MTRLSDALARPHIRYMGQVVGGPIRALVIKIKPGDRQAVILAPKPCVGCGLVHMHAPGCGIDMGAAAMHPGSAAAIADKAAGL